MTGRDLVLAPWEAASPVTALTAGAATITLSHLQLQHPQRPAHWRAAVEFYTSIAGTTVATPTAGTITVTAKISVLPGVFLPLDWEQDPSAGGGVVDLSVLNEPVDWDSGGVLEVKAVMAGVSGGGATHCVFRIRGDGV